VRKSLCHIYNILPCCLTFFILHTGNTVQVDPSRPEGHREFVLVPFQDHPDNGVLHNGFGIEILGADFNAYREGGYRAWLKSTREVVLQLPVARSTFTTDHSRVSYQAQRQRLGGHSETYELARTVVRNRILGQNTSRRVYFLLLVFPNDFELTNAVFSPNSTMGEIEPQITPVEVSNLINTSRTILGVELDIAWAVTIIEDEPRTVTAAQDSCHAQDLEKVFDGMTFTK